MNNTMEYKGYIGSVEFSETEKAYKGSFNVRISPELHKKAVVYAYSQQVSLNRVMEDALNSYIISKEK